MPHSIRIENVHVEDTFVPADYDGLCLWNNYNALVKPETKASFTPLFHYAPCKKMTVHNLTTASGKPWKLCANPLLTPVEELIEEI